MLDFDGTLVSRDILDVVCGIVGKEAESDQLNREFHAGQRSGVQVLVDRINFLKGVTQAQIDAKLQEEPYLMPHARELMAYLNEQGIVSILNSGNIVPVLRSYQKILGITHIVGSEPIIEGSAIQGITEDRCAGSIAKFEGAKRILDSLGIAASETAAIGDSPADRPALEFAGLSIAINPKGGVESAADYVISDLAEAVGILQKEGS